MPELKKGASLGSGAPFNLLIEAKACGEPLRGGLLALVLALLGRAGVETLGVLVTVH